MRLRLDNGAELFYTVDDFTDPWIRPETIVLHHGMAKNHKLWYAWAPILAQHYRVVRFDIFRYMRYGPVVGSQVWIPQVPGELR